MWRSDKWYKSLLSDESFNEKKTCKWRITYRLTAIDQFNFSYSFLDFQRIMDSNTDSLFRCLLCYNFEKRKTTRACVIRSLHKKCPYLDLFWSVFSRIRAKYGKIGSICQYSVRKQENADQNNFWQSTKATSRNAKWDKIKLIMGGSLLFEDFWDKCLSVLNTAMVYFERFWRHFLQAVKDNSELCFSFDKRREGVFAVCFCLFSVSFCLEIDFF